jgi:hypothetical protein
MLCLIPAQSFAIDQIGDESPSNWRMTGPPIVFGVRLVIDIEDRGSTGNLLRRHRCGIEKSSFSRDR